jgi:asparagine synthase (glutamine-hydrolysing)
MCGIAGQLSWSHPPDAEAVAAMTAHLVHRGPDGTGQVERGAVSLGHRRLAIIDLDPASDQPLTDSSGSHWIVFNGEIYNYRELRSRLEREGGRFRSHGDTEVIVEAYRLWGDRFVEELDGMFAFALWDEPRQRLLLARDRAGEKPLYFQVVSGSGTAPDGLLFASELGALRIHPRAAREIDPTALGQFISLGYSLGERTLIAGIRRLPPAHLMVVERGRPVSSRCYWDLAPRFRTKIPRTGVAEAAEELGRRIDAAVESRLVADVPLGAFLSGGIDSSTVVEAMRRVRPVPAPRAFSIGFHEDSFDELPAARAVARDLEVDLASRYVGVDAARALEHLVAVQGEPFADTSIVPFYFLARFAREQVTVCLSGDGGDELFAGYPTYRADRLRHRTRWIPGGVTATAGRLFERLGPTTHSKVGFDYKLRQFLSGHRLDARRAHHHWRVLFAPEQKRALLRPQYREAAADDGFGVFSAFHDEVEDCHYLDQAMYVDIKTWLVDDILFKVDRATMAHSLEARAPFLDPRVVELAASLPVDWKLRAGASKYLLRRVARDRLPRAVLRRPKRGFNAPVSNWLAGDLEPFARAAMADGPLFDWVERDAVERLWREHRSRDADHGLRLFTLLCLALWMRSA